LSDSPWNVNNRKRRAPQPLKPDSAQVRHVPLQPPAEESRPQARAGRRLVKARQAQQQQQFQAAQLVQQPVKEEKRAKKPLPVFFLVVLSITLVISALGMLRMSASQARLDGLKAERLAEEQRKLAHRMEHLNARSNSGFMDLIEKYAREYNISPSFLSAIIKCESSYRPEAISRVNARGLMQIMPDTGTWLAGRLNLKNYKGENLFDPETNIRFGAYYLAYLSDMFNGSPVMVASAYHAGANNVKHWAMARAGDQKTITIDQIPMADTLSYVRKVMDAYAIYNENDQKAGLQSLGFAPLAGAFSSPGE
jgi:soluble lytic murein transglycosylase